MLSALKEQPADKILALMQMYRKDPRPVKIDLGVGVFRNAEGTTPVMGAIKAAEQQLWQDETTKSYVALAGDPAFGEVMRTLLLADAVTPETVAAAATPGGTGAVRQAFELAQLARPGVVVHVSAPTWPNHLAILKYLGIPCREYRYFDEDTCAVDFDAMVEDLGNAGPGDVVLLHGCCHNPTGANLNLTQWQTVADLLNDRGAVPMIDIAYQGFGDGLEEDAAPTRLIARGCPEVLIAASCSKNFGIYRERTGLLLAVSQDRALVPVAQDNLNTLNRLNYSFPPDHGARLVTMVLQDETLRIQWQTELEQMRSGMLALRQQLAGALREHTGSDRFGFVAQHRGMFSRLGLPPEAVKTLREKHAIYMVGDSRINVAGLNAETVPILAKAIAEVAG